MRWDPQVLRDYALLADGTRGALVGPGGEIVWLVLPALGQPRHARLASRRGRRLPGRAGRPAGLGRLLRARHADLDLPLGDRRGRGREPGRARPARTPRPGGTAAPDHRDSRRRRPWTWCCSLRTDYGRAGTPDLLRDDDGHWHGRLGAGSFHWSGAPDVRAGDGDLRARLQVEPGRPVELVLVLAADGQAEPVDPAAAWAATEEGWRRRVPRRTPAGPRPATSGTPTPSSPG